MVTYSIPTVKRVFFLFTVLFVAATVLACDLASLTGGGTTAQPTQPPVAQATGAPSQPGQPTQPASSGQPTLATKQPVPTAQTSSTKKLVSADELNSYRMKMTFRAKEDSKTGDSVTTIEAVKNPPAKHIVMGNIEVITIGNQTWTKIGGKWIQQSPSSSQQAGASGISDDVLKQLEEKYTLQEVGKETINGISCKRYTYKGEATIPAQAGFQGEITMRAQGEAWVADQTGLPPVAIRQRGDLEMQSNVAPGAARPVAMTIKFSFESELYDINTPITITPPTGAQPAPTAPATKPTAVTKPTVVRSPTPKAGAPTSAPTIAAGAQLFADEFNSATLNAKWKWEDRWQDAQYDLKARTGFIRITAPTGNDLWPTTNFDAPFLVQPVDGNFIVETAVEFDPTEDFQGAGILIYQDDDNLVRLEHSFGGTGGSAGGIHLSVIRDGTNETITDYDQVTTNAKRVELRVQRIGDQFTAWWREPNKTWQSLGSVQATMASTVDVGVAVLAEWGVADSVADFDYVRISRPK